MPPAGDKSSLMNRSPRSRKSLALGSSGSAHAATASGRRKRAHSIAPGENLKVDAARRRSLLRPTKGILKPFTNQADQTQDSTQDVSQACPASSPEETEVTGTIHSGPPSEFHTIVHDNPSRKSLGGRRVSFAAHAHVRVFDSAEQNTNGTSSPGSSPAAASPAAVPQTLPSQDEPEPQSPSRRASVDNRRRSSVHASQDDLSEGEESMDVSADDIPPPTFTPSFLPVPPQPQVSINLPPDHIINESAIADSDEDDDADREEEEEGDMSMTGDFGPGIVSRRQTMSTAGRRRSRMRSSIAIPPTGGGSDTKEFTVSLDRPPPPESDAFKALKAIANGGRVDEDDDERDAASEDGEADMDVTTAMTRLMAVRDSVGGQFQMHNAGAGSGSGEDSFTSTEDSFDGVDMGDRTMNMTSLMGSFRASDIRAEDDGDATMSVVSVVGGPILVPPAPVTASVPSAPPPFVPAPPKPTSTLPSVPVFKPSAPTAPPPHSRARVPSPAKASATRPPSPVKQPIKQFTAAFAPPTLKRPSNQDGPTSPSKRRAVSTNESSTQRIPVPAPTPAPAEVPVAVASPKKGLPNKARRPSGYYRKSLAGANEAATTSSAQLASSTAGAQRRQSVAPPPRPASPQRTVAPPASKLPALVVKTEAAPREDVGREGDCALEKKRQSIAVPSPTRGSPAPASPAGEARHREEEHAVSPVEELVKAFEVVREATPTPPFSPEPVQTIDPGGWASTVDGDNALQEDDLAPISVDQFFMMTGIRFMDDLTCPRRSTVHPSQLQRRESNEGETESYPLSDYAMAMTVDIAQLETMTWISNDIRSAIEKFKAQYRETEEDAAKDIPFLFREYAVASEEDREQILYVLKLIKAHTILSAKASWYEWKRGWVQGLQTNAERVVDNLDADERQLADIIARAGQTLPSLRCEYEEITRELEQEKAAVAEIENCDQTFLSELKATIAEQRQELDVYRNDIADGTAKLTRLEATLEDLEDQAREAKSAIMTAQRHMDMQKTSTRAEVFRLRDELGTLQDLHLWRATQLSSEIVEFIYDSKYRITIPCRRFSPIPDALNIVPFGSTSDDFPLVTEIMYRIARHRTIQDHNNKLTLRTIVQRLTDFWASYAQLRWQLSFIIIKYPLSFQLMPAGSSIEDAKGFKATATLLLHKKTSKVLVSFHFDSEMLSNWPATMDSLHYEVSVVYGKANSEVVGEALKTRLAEASTVENHACLVDACMEVVSRYS